MIQNFNQMLKAEFDPERKCEPQKLSLLGMVPPFIHVFLTGLHQVGVEA